MNAARWKKNQKRGNVSEASKPREVVMDTVDPGEVFAFSGIDIFTREADVILRPALTPYDGLIFLQTCMRRRFDDFAEIIQTARLSKQIMAQSLKTSLSSMC